MLKKIIVIGIAILFILSLVNFVSAEFWACFTKGDFIDFCNPLIQDRTCGSTLCKYCMDSYEEPPGCYVPGNFNVCNALPPNQQGCNTPGGNATIDLTPPELTLISPSPLNNSLFTSTSVELIYALNEKSDVYYFSDRERWIRMCNDCTGTITQRRRFDEGFNLLNLKAVDVVGNTAYVDASFFIDSKKPKISKTEPRNGFVASEFYIEFTEENPESLVLYYGNSLTGFNDQEVDLSACFEPRKGRKGCNVPLELGAYDGQDVEYWYILTDIAGNSVESRHNTISVDETDPVINYINYPINRRTVTFNISITEQNFDSVEYIDYNVTRPRWSTLCSRLKDDTCIKSKSFRTGNHTVGIQVTDKAGNAVGQGIEFTIV